MDPSELPGREFSTVTQLRISRSPVQNNDSKEPLSLTSALPIVNAIAREWNCELIPTREMLIPPFNGKQGFLLLPEIMQRLQGILIAENSGAPELGTTDELTVERDEEATTWEDFLLMKVAHTLAAELDAQLYYNEGLEPIEIAQEDFATFEHYVDRVLEFEDDLVREMKKAWIYAHKKRAVR